MAEEIKKTNNTKPAGESRKTYTEAELHEIVNKAVAEAVKAAMQNVQPQTVYVKDKADEYVTLLYMGVVAEGSTVHLNDRLGDIQGRGGTRDIPKKEFLQNLTPGVLDRLKDRRLIVLSGLTDDERERYGLKYEDGELLSPDIYYKLLSLPEDTICKIFKLACPEHKAIIATLYIDAYMAHDNRVNQPLIQRLNNISKEADKDGMFKAILKDMARVLADNAD